MKDEMTRSECHPEQSEGCLSQAPDRLLGLSHPFGETILQHEIFR